MDRDPALEKAAAAAGSLAKLGRALGLDPSTAYSWKRVPAEHVVRLAPLVGMAPHELRPDIFPAPTATAEAAS